jgi:hypothetical protein
MSGCRSYCALARPPTLRSFWGCGSRRRRTPSGHSALLGAAEDRFRAVGAARADAMVLHSNDLGQSLWRAGGYRSQDEWRRWVKLLG